MSGNEGLEESGDSDGNIAVCSGRDNPFAAFEREPLLSDDDSSDGFLDGFDNPSGAQGM